MELKIKKEIYSSQKNKQQKHNHLNKNSGTLIIEAVEDIIFSASIST